MKRIIQSVFLLAVLLSGCVGAPVGTTGTPEMAETDEARPSTESGEANQAPVFPTAMSIDTKTEYKYDSDGRLMGGITTITILTPAIDPDGDTLTYIWKGTEIDHYNQTTFPSKIDYDGLVANWDQSIIMGELASAIMTITASDGKGGETSYKLCMGTRVICN